MYFYSVLDREPRNNKSLIRLFEHNGLLVASQEKLDLMHVPRREARQKQGRKKDKWLFGWKISASASLLFYCCWPFSKTFLRIQHFLLIPG